MLRCPTALILACTLAACREGEIFGLPFEIEVAAADTNAIWFRMLGAPLGIRCSARSVLGQSHPVTVTSSTGVISGSDCNALAVVRSGHDTLVLRAGNAERRVPIVVAAPAELASELADRLTIDDLPPDPVAWWAPSAQLNARDEVELYAAAYRGNALDSTYRADLYRLIQTNRNDPLHFRVDTIVLRPDSNPCSLRGSGTENVAIVPRAEGAGVRMFLSAGSFYCYDWQVFSAVSIDGRQWSLEPGIRVPNDGLWPVGEGMVVRRLPATGEWEMIVGGTVPDTGRSWEGFEIVEWRSTDQLTWRYHGALLTRADLGLPPGHSLYSPTIREFAPGLYRMVFAEDVDPVSPTRLYTAVSVDGEHWRFEGTLLDYSAVPVFYASLVGERLYTITAPTGVPDVDRYLSAFTLRMP